MYQKRKERANEMDDNYDYLSQDKEKNENENEIN